MSEHKKKNRLSAVTIVIYIICAAALIAAAAAGVKYTRKAAREEESRRQSAIAESESVLAEVNGEEDRLLNQTSEICKKHKYSAKISLKKTPHEPSSRYSYLETTEDPAKYEIEISVQLDPPEKIKDWMKFGCFLDELNSIKALPPVELSVNPYYMRERTKGSEKAYDEERYWFSVDNYGLVIVACESEPHYIGLKKGDKIMPLSEIMPYVGMPENLINSTKLGKATSVDTDPLKHSKFYDREVALREGRHMYYWMTPYYANRSTYLESFHAYYHVGTRNGVVDYIKRYPENETEPKASSSSGGLYSSGSRKETTTKKKTYYDDDPYNARDFADPEDFYDYYYDDFEDYEEAYDYFYEHNPD